MLSDCSPCTYFVLSTSTYRLPFTRMPFVRRLWDHLLRFYHHHGDLTLLYNILITELLLDCGIKCNTVGQLSLRFLRNSSIVSFRGNSAIELERCGAVIINMCPYGLRSTRYPVLSVACIRAFCLQVALQLPRASTTSTICTPVCYRSERTLDLTKFSPSKGGDGISLFHSSN